MRKHNYHVFTPFSRTENFSAMADMLRLHGIQWHIVHEIHHAPYIPESDQAWILPSMCPTPEPGWFPGHWKFNWMLNNTQWVFADRYMMLSDDDFLEPGFFDKMDAHEGEVLICSMHRGHRTPNTPGIPPYATDTLIASPGNLRMGGIGGQQIMMAGSAYRRYRLEPGMAGDWQMIAGVLLSYQPVFVPEAFVWFNYLEPGRWIKP